MSAKVTGMVWDMDLPRDEKFVLLAYADHADHDGTSIFPSVALVMRMTGYSERSVQTITRRLRLDGRLVLDGKGPHGTNKYRIPLELAGANPAPQGVQSGAEGVQPTAPGGAVAVTPEPSLTVIKPKDIDASASHGELFKAVAEVCKIDPKTAGASIGKVAKGLAKAGYAPEEVRAFGKWWWGDKGMRKRPPRVWDLQEQIGVVRRMDDGKPLTDKQKLAGILDGTWRGNE